MVDGGDLVVWCDKKKKKKYSKKLLLLLLRELTGRQADDRPISCRHMYLCSPIFESVSIND